MGGKFFRERSECGLKKFPSRRPERSGAWSCAADDAGHDRTARRAKGLFRPKAGVTVRRRRIGVGDRAAGKQKADHHGGVWWPARGRGLVVRTLGGDCAGAALGRGRALCRGSSRCGGWGYWVWYALNGAWRHTAMRRCRDAAMRRSLSRRGARPTPF